MGEVVAVRFGTSVTAGRSIVPGVSFLFESLASGGTTCADSPGKRNTKLKGDISELRVAITLVEAGYIVSKPFGENARYDLIADDGRQLLRVQVKTGRIRGDVVIFNTCSTHGHRRTEAKSRPYIGQVDFLAVYCPDNGKVYLVPEADLTRSKIQLRLAPTRNNMEKTIRWASRYELLP